MYCLYYCKVIAFCESLIFFSLYRNVRAYMCILDVLFVFLKFYMYMLHCRVVTYKTGKTLADSWKAAFFESSAKENSVS